MKAVLIAGALVMMAGEASAISRYQTMSMDCGAVQSAVRREGEAILRWQSPRNLPIYDRYVRDRRFCQMNEVARRTNVPTADTQTCQVRKCVKADPLFKRRWLWIPED